MGDAPDMPETIFVKRDVVMDDEGEWITCTPLRESFTRTDTIGAMLIEAERRGMMRAAEIIASDAETAKEINAGMGLVIRLIAKDIRTAAAELEAKP